MKHVGHDGINYTMESVAACPACPNKFRDAAKSGDSVRFITELLAIAKARNVYPLELPSKTALREINVKMLGGNTGEMESA